MCVMHGGFVCNWVALPELSVALTLKPSLVLENRRRAARSSEDRDLTGLKESEAARSALF